MAHRPKEILSHINRRKFIKNMSVLASGILLSKHVAGSSWTVKESSVRSTASPTNLLLHNFRLFDGVNNKLQNDLMVFIADGKIQSVEPLQYLSTITGYEIIDLKGKTLLPGLIDNHVHITVPFMSKVNLRVMMQMDEQIELNYASCVLSGITTVRDTGGFPEKILKFGALADRNEIPGPRVIPVMSAIAPSDGKNLGYPQFIPYFTNPVVKKITGGNFALRPRNTEEIKASVEEMIQMGAQWIKSFYQEESYTYAKNRFPNFSDQELKTIVETARQHGVKCCIHELFVSAFKKGVDAGFHTFEHTPMDAEIPDAYINRFMEKGMAIMPTILVFKDSFNTKRLMKLVEDESSNLLVPEAKRQTYEALKELIDNDSKELTEKEKRKLSFENKWDREHFPMLLKNLEKLHERGATIGIGTDSGGTTTGFFNRYYEELIAFTEAGFSAYETLKMATSVNAAILGMQEEIGSVDKNKQADIIAVEGNPLEQPECLRKIDLVMKGGVIIKKDF